MLARERAVIKGEYLEIVFHLKCYSLALRKFLHGNFEKVVKYCVVPLNTIQH